MKRKLCIWIGVVCLLFVPGCERPPELQKIEGRAQGTTYHVSWWGGGKGEGEQLKATIAATFADVDKKISNYRDDSDIEVFNHRQSTEWQSLPADVVDLLALADHVYRSSGGCYDPTVKPLFDLWGFRKDSFRIPGAEEITAARANVGFDKVELDVSGHRVRKRVPQVSIDMSSVGEGYTAWRLSKVMEQADIRNYLVEIGGDMQVKGGRSNREKWRIAIARPLPGDISIDKVIDIADESGVSVNTSGTYRHYYDADGKRYSHIFDPRTGAPVTHDLVSATVFGNDARLTDAWATAMLCLGKESGERVAEQEGLAVFFIQQQGTKLIESESPALQKTKAVRFR